MACDARNSSESLLRSSIVRHLGSPLREDTNKCPSKLRRGEYTCRYPGCENKVQTFTRPADLERHYKNVHTDPDMKDSFRCDYRKCGRSYEPFTRKDHFRDHLRDYHKEPIGSAKGEKSMNDRGKWQKAQRSWLDERVYEPDWWRCVKCLCRIMISGSNYECDDCKVLCEPEFVNRIESLRQNPKKSGHAGMRIQELSQAVPPASTSYSCLVCEDTGWFWQELGNSWDPCTSCEPSSWSTAQFEMNGLYYDKSSK